MAATTCGGLSRKELFDSSPTPLFSSRNVVEDRLTPVAQLSLSLDYRLRLNFADDDSLAERVDLSLVKRLR